MNNGLKQLNKNPIFFIKLDKMETTWVGLDIYQPKKVENISNSTSCIPLSGGKLSYTLVACIRCLTIGGEHTSNIDPACCETFLLGHM